MTEDEFKKLFVVQFLASYAAQNYDDTASGMREWDSLQPVEDAEELADMAWDKYVNYGTYVQYHTERDS